MEKLSTLSMVRIAENPRNTNNYLRKNPKGHKMNFRQWFCRHKWIKHSETILPSAFEQAARTGATVARDVAPPMWIFKKKFILTYICEKCQKIKQFTQVNPTSEGENW